MDNKTIKINELIDVVTKLIDGEEIEEFEYDRYKLNPKKEHVDLIVEGLKAKDRYCPCKVGKEEKNICPCDDFIETGKCCCKLWVER